MKKLYSASNLPDAHLIRNMLEEAGIHSHVFNENAQGGVGQLPVADAYPQVWIANERDLDVARKLVDSFEHMPDVAGTLRCPQCAEESPSTFQLCWNCGSGIA